ncbi:hypothetical protein MMC10_004345 [Thelotrema lepadinum]|nr:hypothetical protein [Thelotrema lepadinum]
MQFFTIAALLMGSGVLSAPVPSEDPILPTGVSPNPVKRDLGSATIINNCPFDVSLDRVTDVDTGEQLPVAANGGQWTEEYQTRADGGGISIKVNNGDPGNIAQFEYTIDWDMGLVFYDLSLINGDPFSTVYQGLIPDDQTCPQVQCQPDEQPCAAAYNSPYENKATHGCAQTSSVAFYLCGPPAP